MTIAVDDLVDRARTLIRDQTGVRWPTAELIDWLNDGQREIVLLQPKAGAKNVKVDLVAGTKQTIPSDGVQLLRVTRNMGVNGLVPGRAIWEVDRDVLDIHTPDWHTQTQAAEIKHYVFDPIDPQTFYVFPPSDASTQIELIYSGSPTAVAGGGNISIPDIYANALLDYMVYRAYLKDSDTTANQDRANYAYQTFSQALGVKQQQDVSAGNDKGPTGVATGQSNKHA